MGRRQHQEKRKDWLLALSSPVQKPSTYGCFFYVQNMQVEIKFKRTGSHSVYGNFAAGDVMRCDKALAEFYVRDGVAKYTAAPEVAPEQPAKRGRKAKE